MSFLSRWLGRGSGPSSRGAKEAAASGSGSLVGSPTGQAWKPTHRHRKGGLYRFLAVGCYEADRSSVAIYDDAEGTVWVRAMSEFSDGRFRLLSAEDPAP